ncbi:MAG: CDP-alcohol phosphatidyltransferase family protein [Proteobacteria bacterium]|nr:CDP-alcohol phosphatidyltransferase family protein [Pseudomonadota bacterium]
MNQLLTRALTGDSLHSKFRLGRGSIKNLTIQTALIICPTGDYPVTLDHRLLGLTIGERILLALEMGGVKRVVFVGNGPRPVSSRANVEIVRADDAVLGDNEDAFALLAADVVFDPKMLKSLGEAPNNLPVRRLSSSEWLSAISSADEWLMRLGQGFAESGVDFAIRVIDRRSARAAERSLLRSMRKPIDGFISRNLNRWISLFFTRWLVRTGIRPNQLTVFIMAMGVLSAVAAAFAEHWWALVLAGILFQAQSIFDGCDGEIARLTYRFSYLGQWLDTIGDDMTNYLFFGGLVIGQARVLDLPWLYLPGAITFLTMVSMSAVMYQRIAKMGTGDLLAIEDTLTTGQYTGFLGSILKLLRMISKRDFFVFLVAIGTAAQLPFIAMVMMGIGAYPAFFLVTANELRLRRKEQGSQSTSSV